MLKLKLKTALLQQHHPQSCTQRSRPTQLMLACIALIFFLAHLNCIQQGWHSWVPIENPVQFLCSLLSITKSYFQLKYHFHTNLKCPFQESTTRPIPWCLSVSPHFPSSRVCFRLKGKYGVSDSTSLFLPRVSLSSTFFLMSSELPGFMKQRKERVR